MQNEIAEAAIKCGRRPEEITLVAVTKTLSDANIAQLYSEGQRDFAESRVQSALKRKVETPADCRWHLIGSLQSNKVRKAIGNFVLIHSVDSLELAQKISLCSLEMEATTSILLQANCSEEESKHGLTTNEWKACFDQLLALPNLSIQGLMTMAPLVATESETRRCFSQLRHLRDALQAIGGERVQLHELSMGMSKDFKWAIAEGATIVRLGSVFQEVL